MAKIKVTKRSDSKLKSDGSQNKNKTKSTSRRKPSTTASNGSRSTRLSNDNAGKTAQAKPDRSKSSPSASNSNEKPLADLARGRLSTVSEEGDSVFTFNQRQRKSWRLMDIQMREELEKMMDRDVKLVTARYQDRGVQTAVRDVNRVLKAKLSKLLVPRTNHCNYGKLRAALSSLEMELETNKHQTEALERAIREEERKIEVLEDVRDSTETTDLCLQVPKNTLNLPVWTA